MHLNKRRFFYSIPVILLLIVAVAGWFATDKLGNKARQEIIGESHASALTVSIHVSSTLNNLKGAVKSLAGSPWIAPALLSKGAQDIKHANSVLDRYNSALNASVSYLMDADGMTVASSNRNDPDSFVGKSYRFRPYFREAAKGQPGYYFALGITSGKRGFYASYPVHNRIGKVVGVVTMKKDLDEMETFFSKYAFCSLISPDGIIFLSSRPSMVLKSLWPLDKAAQEKLIASLQFGNKPFEAIIKKEIADGTEVTLDGKAYYVTRTVIDIDGWSLVLLAPTDRIRHYKLIGILATIPVCLLILFFSGVVYVIDRSKEVLRESEERFKSLYQESPIPTFTWRKKEDDFILIDFNKAAIQMTNSKVVDYFGNSAVELYRNSPQVLNDMNYCFQEQSVVKKEIISKHFAPGKFLTVTYGFISPDLIIVHTEDQTDRKQAEEALRKSERQLADIIEFLPDATLAIDKERRVIIWNKAIEEMTGVPASEIIGKGDYAYTIPFYGEARPQLMDLVFEDRDEITIRYPQIKRKGDAIIAEAFCNALYDNKGAWVIAKASPLHDQSGNIIGAIESIRDITDLKRAEEEHKVLQERLNRAEKMEALGTLAGGVAHDLNNVLGVVVGYAELVLMAADESSMIKPHLVNIMNGGLKAAAIVDDLLTLARRGVSDRDVLNLNKIIANCQKSPEFEKLYSYHPSVEFKTDIDPDLLNISGSSVHIGKTLFNLISNASEAMAKGGVVTIKTTNQYLDKPIQGYDQIREGDYVVLSVSDTGEGISADDLKRIFEPFYTKKVMGRSGTGLGLAVVWGTVKDHHGYINVESKEGKGSIFTLYFPVTREDITADAVAIDISEYMGKGESILVVDDVKEQRDLAADMLRTLNYNVSSVSSGEEAIAYMKDHRADLMVLDMIMDPGIDGRDTYRSILEIHSKQRAIIVSGFSESDRVRAAKGLGAGAYVRKPYIKEKLGLAVRKELDRST